MNNTNTAIVAMDLTDYDDVLLKYTQFIAPTLNLSKIYFMHIIPDMLNPSNLDLEFHKLFSPEHPVDERIRHELAAKVQIYFNETYETDLMVEVHEGKPYEKLLHWADVKGVDFIITGRKEESEGSGITAKRLARNAKCNILFVPKTEEIAINKIVVPVDFSTGSAVALKAAVRLGDKLEASVKAFHVVEMIPVTYYTQFTVYREYNSMKGKAARKALSKMLREIDIPEDKIEKTFVENAYTTPAEHIKEYLDKNKYDLMVVGAKGHSAVRSFFLGSVTENVLTFCPKTPTLIVR